VLELGEERLVLLVPQPKLMESENGEMGKGTVTSSACSLDSFDVPSAVGINYKMQTHVFVVALASGIRSSAREKNAGINRYNR
jgi:hypothetical protein